ncbi:hypothetical protein CERSUDRAFT_117051 [Gelatoporia subvermispora B]|uniref:Uncharacterized protein n=1 Tax=Ceriporiopsis subvermispora (strain B) TaxID=914234 RepID=M2QRP6_CERS8|nr:hypothetical protein CERSUDRAFT_117051 [Gelatoporia subvermispora B]
MQMPLPDYIGALPVFENLVGRSVLYLLSDQLVAVPDKVLDQRSPYGPCPTFFLSARRYCEWNRFEEHPSVAWDQLSQFLVYQSSEQAAECAIAMALDGIPSTLVRKRPLVVDRKSGNPYEPRGVDCSLLYNPVSPTTRRSQARMHYLPICQAHPSLVLCSKGPVAWTGSEDLPGSLSSVLEDMASTATISLDSLVSAWSHRKGRLQVNCPSDIPELESDGEHALPGWAFLLGIVYDAEEIHFIAHIPRIHDGETEYKYISLLFETLPFPAIDTSNSSENSLQDRYRVALAFLCLQHHIFRLTSLWDGVAWPLEVVQEPLNVMRKVMDSWCDTPTPSQAPSDFMPLPPGFEIDGFDDEDDDPTHISDPITAPVKVRPRVDEWLKTLEGCSFEELEPWIGVV